MFKDQYPVTWRLAAARLEALRKEALENQASDSKAASSGPSTAHEPPLLSIAIPIDGPGGIAIRLVRSGSTLTATVTFGCASDALVEAAP